MSNVKLKTGDPASFNLKTECQACRFNVQLHKRPAWCECAAPGGVKCPDYKPCPHCGRNVDYTGKMCAECVAAAQKKVDDEAVKIQRAVKTSLIGVPTINRDEFDDLTDDEWKYFERQHDIYGKEMGDKMVLSQQTVELLIRNEIKIKRGQVAQKEIENIDASELSKVSMGRLTFLREQQSELIKEGHELRTQLGITMAQQRDAPETQYEKALSTALENHWEYILEFGIGLATKAEQEDAWKQKSRIDQRKSQPDGNGEDLSHYRIAPDGRLIGPEEAEAQSRKFVEQFKDAREEGDKKKLIALMMRDCLIDPVAGAVTLLWQMPSIFQKRRLRAAWVTKVVRDHSSNGVGKTWTGAALVMLRSIVFPRRRSLIIGGSQSQGDQYFEKWEEFRRRSPIVNSQIAVNPTGKQLMSRGAKLSYFLLKNESHAEIIAPNWGHGASGATGKDKHDLYLLEVDEFSKQELVETILFMRARATWWLGGDDHPIFQDHFHLEGAPGVSERDACHRRVEEYDKLVEEWLQLQNAN